MRTNSYVQSKEAILIETGEELVKQKDRHKDFHQSTWAAYLDVWLFTLVKFKGDMILYIEHAGLTFRKHGVRCQMSLT